MPYRRMSARGRITKIRGRTLTIDKGADDGLEVTILPDEAIIHPLTEKNLGAPRSRSPGAASTRSTPAPPLFNSTAIRSSRSDLETWAAS